MAKIFYGDIKIEGEEDETASQKIKYGKKRPKFR